jgi:hypothetical protein
MFSKSENLTSINLKYYTFMRMSSGTIDILSTNSMYYVPFGFQSDHLSYLKNVVGLYFH